MGERNLGTAKFDRLLGRPVGRRRFLRGGAAFGAAVGVTTLAGCAPASTGGAAATVAPAPSTAAASAPPATAPTAVPKVKLGGTFRGAFQNEAPNLDPH